jgi:hypothetical protein
MELTLRAVRAARISVFTVKTRSNIPWVMMCAPLSGARWSDPPMREIELQAGWDNSASAGKIYAPDAQMLPVIPPIVGRAR